MYGDDNAGNKHKEEETPNRTSTGRDRQRTAEAAEEQPRGAVWWGSVTEEGGTSIPK